MKKHTIFNLMLAFLLGSGTLATAQTYTIGADNGIPGPTNYPSPFGDYYKTMRAQYLYRASELTAMGMTAGFITEISWNVVALPGGIDGTEDYTIKLLNSGATSLGLTTWEEGATTVWGPTDYNPTLGINTFSLATPFFWDGVSSVIVEICGGDFNATFTKNARVTWTGPLAFNGSHTHQSDTEPNPCGYTGIEYWENAPGGPDYRPQVIFTTTPGTDCAVVPSLGVTATTATNVCIGEEFTLSVTPVTALGITYTWSSSPDGASWTIIPGATSPSYTTTQTATTLYRCKVTCTISGDFKVSTAVTVNQNDPTDCYCIPTYTTGTTDGDYLNNVHLGAINNTTGASASPFYTYYTVPTTTLTGGTTNTLTAQVGTYATNNNFAVWIDYNQNGNFESTEKIGEVINLAGNATGTINFTVPITALAGETRMRCREVWNQVGILPCDPYGFGETEDYNVTIVPGVVPTAAFTFTGDPTVSFTNTSTGLPTSYSWNFGDGGTSTLTNPTHVFAENDTYNVCLTATNLYGSNTACQNVIIDSYVAPVADFSYSGEPTVAFVDESLNSPTSWFWNFGDGGTSTLENPTHLYTYNGTFNVCMTATNATGSNTSCQFVLIDYYLAPVAAFTYSGDPTVSFTDASLNSPTSWFWNFGDAGTSTLENPTHTYVSNGVYNVCLTATNATGSNTSCQLITIDSYLSPVSSFTFSGDPTVSFTDLSLNAPTSWSWAFGDAGTSTLENPTHTYAANGTYNACLTATNAVGSNTSCQDVVIDSYVYTPVADFIYTGDPDVEFTDISQHHGHGILVMVEHQHLKIQFTYMRVTALMMCV
jgi:PKD repeat protein